MRVIRGNKNNGNTKRRLDGSLYNCALYVREDFTVSSASEFYYAFVGENSALPFLELIEPGDAEIFQNAVKAGFDEPVEIYTSFRNLIDEGYRSVFVLMENTDRTEKGERLYHIIISDHADTFLRMNRLDKNLYKYRHFMTLTEMSYFEYSESDNNYVVYRYINEKALRMVNEDFDKYAEDYTKAAVSEKQKEQVSRLSHYLKDRKHSFEMEWIEYGEDGDEEHFTIKGGVSLNVPELVEGIIVPDGVNSQIAYYLTPAGRDAFTGLMNKRAATEYAIEKLSVDDGDVKWLIIMDIDDFKNVNDTFGHAFGDEVIKKVSDTLQKNMGGHGVAGRFGGDEFFVLLHDVKTREDLKLLLKVIVRELMYAFDDKMRLTLSIGVSQYPKDGTDFETLFGKADKSLYIAKEKGKNRHIIYDEKMHGAYTQDSIKSQAVAYISSRKKRRETLAESVIGVNKYGGSFFLENEDTQQAIMDVFDIDGITIYGNYGKEVILRRGAYASEPEDRALIMSEEGYSSKYEDEDILVISTINRLKPISRTAYDSAVKQEIGACVRCIVRKDGIPYVFVDFDVLNTNRKWSDADIDMLAIFGCSIGALVKEQK